MKKAIFFLLIVLSVTSFAQNLIPAQGINFKVSNLKENILERLNDGRRKMSGIYTGNPFNKMNENNIPRQVLLFPLIDSIYSWQWDTLNLIWKYDYKIIDIIYGPNNLPSSYVQQYWNGAGWFNDTKYILTFDNNGNEILELDQSWNGLAWEDDTQDLFEYDENNNLTLELYQSWRDSVWDNDNQFISTYDASNNQISELNQSWNDSLWENEFLYTYTYDVNNNQLTVFGQYWFLDEWIDILRITYMYDANNIRTSGLVQISNGISWENYEQYTYTYDVENNLIGVLTQNWDGASWVTGIQTKYLYDADNFTTDEVNRYFDSLGVSILYGDSTHYYFHGTSGTNDLKIVGGDFTLYPNPNSGMFSIAGEDIINSIEVYNVLGEKLYSSGKINQQTIMDIDISESGKGIFILFVRSGPEMFSKKIVIQ